MTKIRLLQSFIKNEEANEIFEKLKTELKWQKRFNPVFNLEEPRLTARQGEHKYTYWTIEWGPEPVNIRLIDLTFFFPYI